MSRLNDLMRRPGEALRRARERLTPPGLTAPLPPGGAPLLGHLRDLRHDPLRFMSGLLAHGDVVRLQILTHTLHFVFHPDDIRDVLQLRHRGYHKGTRGYDQLRQILGDGLLTSDGELWLRQRRIAQPAFHKRRVAGFAASMVAASARMAERWSAFAARGQAFDVLEEMMTLTLEIIAETMFGADVRGVTDEVSTLMDYLLPETRRRMTMPAPYERLRTPGRRRYEAAIARLEQIVEGLIEARRRAPEEGGEDLLSMLMSARDEESGEQMSDRQLRDEVLTVFLAGHETTANALAWTWYLLSLHPAASARLRDELDATLGGRTPTIDDLPALRWTRQVVEESMRLYPPAWIIGRTPLEDEVIGGHRVPAGTYVYMVPYVTHRHPALWDNPEGFDPERFAPQAVAARHRYAYFPFSGGPRQCIGNTFAMNEAILVLATLAQRFWLELTPGQQVTPQPAVTLRPRDGVWMTARARS